MASCNKPEKLHEGNVAKAMTKNNALFQHFVILDGNNSMKTKIVEACAIVSCKTVRDNTTSEKTC